MKLNVLVEKPYKIQLLVIIFLLHI